MKKVYIFLALVLISLFGYTTSAQNLEIMPQVTTSEEGKIASDVNDVGTAGGKVWQVYNSKLTK